MMRGVPRKLGTVFGSYSASEVGACSAQFQVAANSHDMVLSGTGSDDSGGWNNTNKLTHQFLVGGSGIKNLEIYVQPTTTGALSGAANTWLALTTTRTWTVSSGASTNSVTFRIRLRDGVTTREFLAANVACTLTAHNTFTDTK